MKGGVLELVLLIHESPLCSLFPGPVWCYYSESSRLGMVGVFISWKLANARNWDFFFFLEILVYQYIIGNEVRNSFNLRETRSLNRNSTGL